MLTLNGIDDIKSRVGEDLGTSEWVEITQENVDAFADVTNDHQWIHVDPERAKDTPFGGTIAHGYYTLSLIPGLSYDMYEVQNVAFGLNYGTNKVRFPAPVPVGSKVRMQVTLSEVTEVAGGVQMTTTCTFEREGGDKPVCVAETVARIYGG